jgi:hypothetical protein
MVSALSGLGLPGKHFVIDTADNGRGFTWGQYNSAYGSGTFNNPYTCVAKPSGPCDTLGVPPTWQIADTRLPLTASQRAAALASADGYLWFGRPWLDYQATPYDNTRALQVASSSPYA